MSIISGISDFGTPQKNGGVRGIAKSQNAPGFLVLQSYNGSTLTDYYIWVDPSGVLRISNVVPTNSAADGTVVGSQS